MARSTAPKILQIKPCYLASKITKLQLKAANRVEKFRAEALEALMLQSLTLSVNHCGK